MALTYDFDMAPAGPQGADGARVARFRDAATVAALARAPQAVRDYLCASGFGEGTHHSGAPAGRYPAADEAARVAVIEALAANVGRFDLARADDRQPRRDAFHLSGFYAALIEAEPIHLAPAPVAPVSVGEAAAMAKEPSAMAETPEAAAVAVAMGAAAPVSVETVEPMPDAVMGTETPEAAAVAVAMGTAAPAVAETVAAMPDAAMMAEAPETTPVAAEPDEAAPVAVEAVEATPDVAMTVDAHAAAPVAFAMDQTADGMAETVTGMPDTAMMAEDSPAPTDAPEALPTPADAVEALIQMTLAAQEPILAAVPGRAEPQPAPQPKRLPTLILTGPILPRQGADPEVEPEADHTPDAPAEIAAVPHPATRRRGLPPLPRWLTAGAAVVAVGAALGTAMI
jgi:hypothetical protein